MRFPARLLALAALVATGAGAQIGAPAPTPPRGFDTDSPVDVSADHIELQDRADRAVMTGNVRIRQGDLGLDTQRVNVAYRSAAGGGSPEIQRLDASGGVVLTRPGENARSQLAIYDLNRRIVTMLGAVVLTRGDSTVRGARLVYDLNSGRATVDGGRVPGGGGAATGGGRVTGRFTVPKRAQ